MLRKSNFNNIHNIKKAGATFVTIILLFCVIIPTINSGKVTFYLNYSEELIEEKTLFPINVKTLSSDNWWDDSWPYRKLITIDHNQINSDQINFPFLVYLSSDTDLADHAQDDGDDIVFILYSDNTTKLNHEIEHFNGINGELIAWVNIPSLSSSEDTKFWIYYGNDNSENQENIEDTWNSNFVMVQHLNEQSGTLFDSTSDNNDGTNDNATFTSSAKIYGAYDFDGIDNNIDVGTFDVIGNGLTISIWFKADSFSENVICTSGLRLISKATGPETSDHFWTIAPADNGDRFRFRLKTTDFTSSNLIVNTGGLGPGTWYNVVATYDGSYMRVYNDGDELGYKTTTGAVATDNTVSVWIGSNPPDDYRAFDGVIDEVRVSNIARDESWIDLSYENQNNPGSFVSISEQELCEYTLTINIEGNGAVTKDPDQETYEYGTEVELTAVPDTGWSFSHWSGDLSGGNNPETITMNEDKTVTAHFTINEYTLTINIEGNGEVTKDPDQELYEYGTEVELTAIPDTGWSFSHWSGDLSGDSNPETITMDEDKTVTAHFTINEYTLTINIEGNGEVTKDPDQELYEYGTEVELTAIPDTGWTFSHWSGDLSGNNNPEYITIDGDKTVTATFTINEYTLTINIEGNGEVTKDPDQELYEYGTEVELTAIPDTGWTFSHWSGDLSGDSNPETITMDEDKTVTAHFTINEYTLTINIEGNGEVTKDPDQELYEYGTEVELTAIPDTGWTFSHWSGDLSGGNNPETITMDEDKTVIANFSENQYTLTIIIEGQGSVLKDPDQNSYEYGTEVELTAVPDTGWSFSHWSGDLSGDSNPETITMDEDKTVIANFSINYYTLTIDIDGQGEVIKNPDLETYEYGTVVEVTAVPDEEWSFSHWSGDLSGSNNPEYITIDENKLITAHFSQNQYTLTINIIGNGTVIKDPDQATYTLGTTVQLTAVPDNGWSFDHWSGDISGNESPTEILIDGDKTVNAHFKASDEPPKVKIIKPDYGLYFQDKKILSFIFPIIFNEVTIEAEASDDTSVEKVEFYVNGELKGTDNEPPYTYHWKDTLKRFYTVEVIAYDNEDNTDNDVLTVFLFGVKYPILWIGLIIILSLMSFDLN